MNEFVRSGMPFNYDTNEASDGSGLLCEDESLAKDSMREETDINVIVARFGISGELPVGVRAPEFGQFTEIFDFQSAMNVVREANEAFMMMPARIRNRFHNDPQEFVAFCSDVDNRAEAERLGLVFPKPVVEAVQAVVVAPKVPGTVV